MKIILDKQTEGTLDSEELLQRSIQRCVLSLGNVIKPGEVDRLVKSLGPKGTHICLTYAMGLKDRDAFLLSLRDQLPKLNVDRLMFYLDLASRIQPAKQDWRGFWSLCGRIEQFQFPPRIFDAVLNDICKLLNVDGRCHISAYNLGRLCTLDAERFQAALEAAQRVSSAGLNVFGFADAVANSSLGSLTRSQSLAVLDGIAGIAILNGPLSWAARELPKLAKTLDSRQLIVLLDVILDLLQEGSFGDLLNRVWGHGTGSAQIIETVAQRATRARDFREELYAVLRFWARNQDSGLLDGELATMLKTETELSARLNAIELLLKRLHAISGWRSIDHNIAGLLTWTCEIAKHYSDYELRYHEPIITEETETSYDSYYGDSTYTHTRELYHAWIELLPCGERLSPVAVPLVDGAALEQIFAVRSWMYAAADEAGRSRALEHCALVRNHIPQVLDSLMRKGLLEIEATVAGIYLIGSYPWFEAPNDIDIFIIVEGDRKVSHYSSAVLAERGVQCPELPLPMDIEIVGSNTLLVATPADQANHRRRLALRRTLLYGSALLAGKDQFAEDSGPSVTEWGALEQDLKNDLKRQTWPELAKDQHKENRKKAWRTKEIKALAEFIAKMKK